MRETTICSMSVYELMADDLDVWLQRNKDHTYQLTVEGFEEDSPAVDEAVHRCAIDSMADFCRRFLHSYERLNREM